MSKKELISIVVPVYNVSKYLRKCVDSIIAQTYKNIEIILVDDGSTDDSGKMCDELTKIDKRIIAFHKKNGGLSDARNYGIDHAKGKYVCFVDSDDYVTPDMCEILYNDVSEFNADAAFCTFVDCYYGIEPKIDNTNIKKYKLNAEEAIKTVMIGDIVPLSAVAKLYKKTIFDKVKFEKGRIYEDAIIMVELIDTCKTIAIDTSCVYYYVHRKNSITTTKFDEGKEYDILYAYTKNKRIIEEKYPNVLDVANMRLCWAHFRILDTMIKVNSEIDEKIVKYLKDNYAFVLKSKYFSKARKVSVIFLKISLKLYILIVKLSSKKFVE